MPFHNFFPLLILKFDGTLTTKLGDVPIPQFEIKSLKLGCGMGGRVSEGVRGWQGANKGKLDGEPRGTVMDIKY